MSDSTVFLLVLGIVIGTSVWVYFDAKSIGAARPCLMAFGCFALWIVFFPMYIASRRKIIQRNQGMAGGSDVLKATIGWVLVAFVVLAVIAPLFSAPTAPSCASEDAKQLVISIVKDKLKKIVIAGLAAKTKGVVEVSDEQLQELWDQQSPNMQITVENIRTKDFNKNVGSYLCAADLNVNMFGDVETHAITYTSEIAVDKDGFYVEIQGL